VNPGKNSLTISVPKFNEKTQKLIMQPNRHNIKIKIGTEMVREINLDPKHNILLKMVSRIIADNTH